MYVSNDDDAEANIIETSGASDLTEVAEIHEGDSTQNLNPWVLARMNAAIRTSPPKTSSPWTPTRPPCSSQPLSPSELNPELGRFEGQPILSTDILFPPTPSTSRVSSSSPVHLQSSPILLPTTRAGNDARISHSDPKGSSMDNKNHPIDEAASHPSTQTRHELLSNTANGLKSLQRPIFQASAGDSMTTLFLRPKSSRKVSAAQPQSRNLARSDQLVESEETPAPGVHQSFNLESHRSDVWKANVDKIRGRQRKKSKRDIALLNAGDEDNSGMNMRIERSKSPILGHPTWHPRRELAPERWSRSGRKRRSVEHHLPGLKSVRPLHRDNTRQHAEYINTANRNQ